MDSIINEILKQVRKIPSLNYREKISPYIFFNVTPEKKDLLYKAIQDEFIIINNELDSMELYERRKILKELQKPFHEQEKELEKRYEGTERYNFVLELHAEANADRRKHALSSETLGSTLKKEYSFKELNIQEYLNNYNELDILNSKMDFFNFRNFTR